MILTQKQLRILSQMRKETEVLISHGLFRIPGYIAALKSKKVKGNARPTNNYLTQNAIRVEGDYGFAPTAIGVGIPALVEVTKGRYLGVKKTWRRCFNYY